MLQYLIPYQLACGSCSTTPKDSNVSDNGKSDWRITLHTYEPGFQTLQPAQWVLCLSGVVKTMDFSLVLCPSCSHRNKYLLDKREKKIFIKTAV